nr:NusG domain II-containing protein [Clostridia bacterium]
MEKSVALRIKNSKPFRAFDLIIYLCVALIIAAVFTAVALSEKTVDAAGFSILYDNKVAAEYRFSDGQFTVKSGYEKYFSANDNGVYFFPDGENNGNYNLIVFDKENKRAKITESTCAGHDCETQTVSYSGGFIYCAPHKLKIIPAGLADPVSG